MTRPRSSPARTRCSPTRAVPIRRSSALNVNRSLMGTPAQPLQSGVHLHRRALPNALAKAGNKADGSLLFPAAPNRWLVSRFVIKDGRATRMSWVVLSDVLNDTLPPGQTSITLPTHTTPSGKDYQYSGQYEVFDQHWTEPNIPAARSFATLTGLPLSAVSSGQSVFASFYPNCRGVFGFIDRLADLDLPPRGTANLMYTVTGWYSDSKQDPLHGGLTLKELQEQLSWTFQSQATAAGRRARPVALSRLRPGHHLASGRDLPARLQRRHSEHRA